MQIYARLARSMFTVLMAGSLMACGGGQADNAPPKAPAEAPQPTSTDEGRVARTLPIPGSEGAAGELPPGHPPLEGAPAAGQGSALVPPPPDSGTGEAALAWRPPQGWKPEPPSSAMRKAQYRVPGPGGDGECVVFYFGPGQGGDPASNAERWAGQFAQADGRPASDAMKTKKYAVGPISVLEVEVTGTYDGGQTMSAEPPTPKPGYMLLGAIAEGPDANWFFKFTGPEATVRSQRAAFGEMIRSLKPGA